MAPPHEPQAIINARTSVEERIAAIDRELAEMAVLQAERTRLSEALELLGKQAPRTRPARPQRSGQSGPLKPGGRGANRQRVLEYLADHPGVEAGPIVEHLGASRGVVYNLLGRLVNQNVIERQQGHGARSRYLLANQDCPDSDGVESDASG